MKLSQHFFACRGLVRVFRSQTSPTSPLDSGSLGDQRKQLYSNTQTPTHGCVNHYERKEGSNYAKLCGLTPEEINSLGCWSKTIQQKHYDKCYGSRVVALLSGFRDSHSYFIPRALATTDRFLKTNPEAKVLFNSFLGFLSEEHYHEEIPEDHRDVAVRFIRAFCLIKEVFFSESGLPL